MLNPFTNIQQKQFYCCSLFTVDDNPLNTQQGTASTHAGALKLSVPNVVHYVVLRSSKQIRQMSFLHYLSFVSVDLFVRPEYIFIHGDVIPSGYWWRRVVTEVANVFHVNTSAPSEIFGRQIKRVEHKADILRYRIVYRK